MHDHRIVVDAVRKDALELSKLMTAAKEIQWESSPAPRPQEESDRQVRGGPPPDPTSSVALDERRLKVREAMRGAESALAAVAGSLEVAYNRLDRALSEWEGEDV